MEGHIIRALGFLSLKIQFPFLASGAGFFSAILAAFSMMALTFLAECGQTETHLIQEIRFFIGIARIF